MRGQEQAGTVSSGGFTCRPGGGEPGGGNMRRTEPFWIGGGDTGTNLIALGGQRPGNNTGLQVLECS
jgi:hypothetical protein